MGRRHGKAVDRCVGLGIGHLTGDGAIGEQVGADGNKGRVQRLADQQGSKAGAIDIEVGGQFAMLGRCQGADGAGVVEMDIGNFAGQVDDAQFAGPGRQDAREVGGVEMVGIAEA